MQLCATRFVVTAPTQLRDCPTSLTTVLPHDIWKYVVVVVVLIVLGRGCVYARVDTAGVYIDEDFCSGSAPLRVLRVLLVDSMNIWSVAVRVCI